MDIQRAEIGNARATEERYQQSIRDVVMEHLAITPERTAYFEAALEIQEVYGEPSPFRVAMRALYRGDRKLYEYAMADDARLTELADAIKD